MRLLKQFLLFVLLLQGGTAAAQMAIHLEPRLGYGTFQMKQLKKFQQSVINDTGVDAKATDNFGPYFQFGVNVLAVLGENKRLGLFYEHGSTGGRVAYEDYSGELRIDTRVSYNTVGLKFEFNDQVSEKGTRFLTGLEANLFLNQLKLEGYSRFYDESHTSVNSTNARGLGAKPYIGVQHPVLHFPLILTLGYLANTNGPIHVPGKEDKFLFRSKINPLFEPDWSGLRLNLTVTFPIFSR